MDVTHRTRCVPGRRTLGLLVIGTALSLLGGCASPDGTLAPGSNADPNGSLSAAGSLVTPTPAPPTSAEPTVAPAATAVPAATITPTPGQSGPRWETIKVPRWFHPGLPVLLSDGRVLVIAERGEHAALWDPVTGTWSKAEGLAKAREGFAAIRLHDGRVLVTGGKNDAGQSYSSSYLWDPATGAWTKTGLMAQARTDPSIALLPDGRVLVAGGYFAVEQDWGMTPGGSTIAWAGTSDDGAVTASLAGTTAAPTGANGRAVTRLAALVPPLADVDIPPWGHGLATAEVFDPATGEWTKTRPMRYARSGAPAVTLADGRVLVTGSAPASLTGVGWGTYGTSDIYDPARDRWSHVDETETQYLPWRDLRRQGVPSWVGDLSTGGDCLHPGTLVALDVGDALLIGRSQWAKHQGEETRSFRFDARQARWREIGTPWLAAGENQKPYRNFTSDGPRWHDATVVGLGDGRVLVAGGAKAGMEWGEGLQRAARLYDPATDTWSVLPRLPEPRADGLGIRLADGSVLIVGGFDNEDGDDADTMLRFVPGA